MQRFFYAVIRRNATMETTHPVKAAARPSSNDTSVRYIVSITTSSDTVTTDIAA